jgi:chorismate mutase
MLSLEEFRSQIDTIDDQILSLLHARMEIVKQIGQLKSEQ